MNKAQVLRDITVNIVYTFLASSLEKSKSKDLVTSIREATKAQGITVSAKDVQGLLEGIRRALLKEVKGKTTLEEVAKEASAVEEAREPDLVKQGSLWWWKPSGDDDD